jgi:hypothetical protein
MVSLPGRMWVEMNAREVKMVAAHSNDSLITLANSAVVADVSAEQGFAEVYGSCGMNKLKQLRVTCCLRYW